MSEETVEVALLQLTSHVETREECATCFKDATCSLHIDLGFARGVLNSSNLFFTTMSLNVCWMHFPVYPELTLTISTVLFMTTFASRVSMSPLSSKNGYPMFSNIANRDRRSLENVSGVPLPYSLCFYVPGGLETLASNSSNTRAISSTIPWLLDILSAAFRHSR